MPFLRIRLADKGVIILLQIAAWIAPFNGPSAFTMIEVHWHVFARVLIFAPIWSPPTINKKFVLAHGTAVKQGSYTSMY